MTLDLTDPDETNGFVNDDYRVNVHGRRNLDESLGNKSVGLFSRNVNL